MPIASAEARAGASPVFSAGFLWRLFFWLCELTALLELLTQGTSPFDQGKMVRARPWLLAAAVALLVVGPSNADYGFECNDETINVLMKLYQDGGGAGWDENDGWLDFDKDPCKKNDNWENVDSSGGVLTKVKAKGGSGTGTLPSEVGLLSSLLEFKIESTGMGGTHCACFAALLAVRVCQVKGATGPARRLELTFEPLLSFSGPLPSELGALTLVTKLTMKGSSFTSSLPSQLGRLTGMLEMKL